MNTLLQHIFLLNDVFRQRPNIVQRHIIGTQTGLSYCLVGVILHLSLPIYLERVKKTDLGLFPCWLPSGHADVRAEFIACLCETRCLQRRNRELIPDTAQRGSASGLRLWTLQESHGFSSLALLFHLLLQKPAPQERCQNPSQGSPLRRASPGAGVLQAGSRRAEIAAF